MLETAEEYNAIRSLPTTLTWIGANDLDKEGEYIWEHSGQNASYQQWPNNQPSPASADEQDCIGIRYTTDWWDMECFKLFYFLCEY